jgi:outer membrane beta-barrel protein
MSLSVAVTAQAQSTKSKSAKRIDVSKDVDSLGGNDALMEMAQAIEPENRSRIVQKRLVDRNTRFELGLSYGGNAGGDSYVRTQNIGGSIDFHINPKWALGLRYYDHGNSLTSEGSRVFKDASDAMKEGRKYTNPDIDYPLNSQLAIISWFPIYGKINMFDAGIAQFDMYLLAGGGQIKLSSGSAGLVTAGAGVGLWLNNYVTARAEIRYQAYKDQIITGSRDIQNVVGTFGLGLML